MFRLISRLEQSSSRARLSNSKSCVTSVYSNAREVYADNCLFLSCSSLPRDLSAAPLSSIIHLSSHASSHLIDLPASAIRIESYFLPDTDHHVCTLMATATIVTALSNSSPTAAQTLSAICFHRLLSPMTVGYGRTRTIQDYHFVLLPRSARYHCRLRCNRLR